MSGQISYTVCLTVPAAVVLTGVGPGGLRWWSPTGRSRTVFAVSGRLCPVGSGVFTVMLGGPAVLRGILTVGLGGTVTAGLEALFRRVGDGGLAVVERPDQVGPVSG